MHRYTKIQNILLPVGEPMENLLKLHMKPDVEYAELRVARISNLVIEMKNGEVTKCVQGTDSGLSIRLLSDGALGFSSTSKFGKNEFARCFENAYKIAKNMDIHDIKLEDVSIESSTAIWSGRKKHAEQSLEEKIRYIGELYALTKQYNEIKSVTLSYMESTIENEYYNTHGAKLLTRVPRTAVRMQIVAHSEGAISNITGSVGGTGELEILDIYPPAEELKNKCASAVRLLHAQRAPSGLCTVVADNALTGVFAHEAVGHACEADGVVAGSSCLAGKIGEKIGNDIVTIVDDPTLPHQNGSFPYDDEGTKARRKVLIDHGYLREFIHSVETATKLKMSKNGGARAESYAVPPLVRMSNTYIEGGDYTFEEMLKEIKFGVYAKGSRGGQVDTTKGTFQFSAEEGFLIENGVLTKPLRDLSLAGDILGVFHQIDAVGNDVKVGHPGNCGKGQWVPVSDGGPHIRIQNARVGGG